jgi:3-methyladenine DNA glycosylase AlkD
MYKKILTALKELGDPLKATILAKFFQVSHGGYGEGDVFVGVSVPAVRKLAKSFGDIGLDDISGLVDSEIHEARLLATVFLVSKYQKASKYEDWQTKTQIIDFYLDHRVRINNWDLVDNTAAYLFGEFLYNPQNPLKNSGEFGKYIELNNQFISSENVWERRISIVSTHWAIKNLSFEPTFEIALKLCRDKHHLIHKAIGWMLREVGVRDRAALHSFLKTYWLRLPSITKSYATEHFDKSVKAELRAIQL